MLPDEYVWTVWSAIFLIPWAGLFLALPTQRRPMLWASAFTAPLGLSEPLFVPAYWNPPSLFQLARTRGFDIESLLFSFAAGGVASVLYNALTRRPLESVPPAERQATRHRFHRLAVAASFVSFIPLWLLPWNPIYAATGAMAIGAAATAVCRPDLARKIVVGSGLFLAYYGIFFAACVSSAPGYVERVWNLRALTGILIGGIPLEELMFAASLGACWAGLYEHVHWLRMIEKTPPPAHDLRQSATVAPPTASATPVPNRPQRKPDGCI